MQPYKLTRTGDAPLVITGDLVAESDGERQANREHHRWHDLAIYRLTDGRYAVAITYRTKWHGELDRHHVRVVRDRADVPAIFRGYDPAAAVRGYPPGDAYRERQESLMADVRMRYEAQVGELLDNDLFAAGADDGMSDLRRERDLGRYRELLRIALASITFTRAEACLLCDANNGIGTIDLATKAGEQTEWRWWPANVEDDIRLNESDKKWGVDGPTFVAKIRGLTPLQLCAVADAMERFWHQPQRDTDDLLREVGLLR